MVECFIRYCEDIVRDVRGPLLVSAASALRGLVSLVAKKSEAGALAVTNPAEVSQEALCGSGQHHAEM
eukprot:12951457-Alexandrium_andersonii.AAC.1